MNKQNKFYIPDPKTMTTEDCASMIQSCVPHRLPEKHRLCGTCKIKPSNHSVGDRRLCCKCYIIEGNCPADWHFGCMKYYKELKNEKAKLK